uniref:Bifunctional inhibitor/plant lipid transfer protein/seed storage helical domain-containing protein n=1 Tax=Aegilops tauschii subsp. strangulata TaxID=200361 RepID=A0A453SWQ2_AEGTS
MTSVKVAGVLCLLVFLAISSCSRHAQASQGVDHCTIDKNKVMRDCWGNIEKNLGDRVPRPWIPCCQTIRAAIDIHCVCDRFTAHELTRISLSKFASVTHVCGNGLHPHTHCAGWYIVIFVHTHM